MLKAEYKCLHFRFRKPAGTSRGVLLEKPSWFISVWDDSNPLVKGVGECSLIPGLSPDNALQVEHELMDMCTCIHHSESWKAAKGHFFPAIQFALETALCDLKNGGLRLFGDSAFSNGSQGIPINGLIWMGSKEDMKAQIKTKIESGFSTIKIKVGALDFEQECDLLKYIRKEFSAHTVEIRLDANGAFHPHVALEKLNRLAVFQVHSIEQPIKPGQLQDMAALCSESPIPVALDEELIGVIPPENRAYLLTMVQPQYIILKPSLLGGLNATRQWAELAQSLGIGWWVTSALESNIGLNAIAHWTFENAQPLHQGLGTGQLFENNFDCPLEIVAGKLFHNPQLKWDLTNLD